MTGTSISYVSQPWQTKYNGRRKKSPITVRRSCCPISNEEIGTSDMRLRYFLVNGEKVAVNGQEFLNFCDRVNWPRPENFWAAVDFEIEPFLKEMAVEAAHVPANQIGDRWSRITEFARLIGLKTDFIKAVRVEA